MVIGKHFAALFDYLSSTGGAVLLAAILGLFHGAPASALARDCELSFEQPWLDDLVASAHVSGACDAATIDLVVHNGTDEVVWSASYGSDYLFGFGDVHDVDTMQMALRDWLGDYVEFSSSTELPDWRYVAEMPDASEFPFYVEEGLSQTDYEGIRAANYPMICYIQGGESTLCVIRQPGISALISVGVQTFPG
ncbi:MAG: hypothetical protein ACSHXI_02590 [Hoeflea sp.]|uniref:hypothetical protein n=1 Tax=Hoeflea sp. TaxID=1940281 RepID=UPI003EF10DF0